MSFLQQVIAQILISFYQLTSATVNGQSLADIGSSVQTSFFQSDLFLLVECISAGISIGLFVWFIRLTTKMHALNQQAVITVEAQPAEPALGGLLQNRWQEIQEHIASNREGEWKYAVIEADKLVDDQLRQLFPGETMGERLMNIDKTQLLTLSGLWEAHKIRNRLAHDVNYFLRHAEAVKAIRLYQQTLKEIGVLTQ